MTYSSPLLLRNGAIAASGIDSGIAGHYGNIFVEQKNLIEGESIVDLSHQNVLKIVGKDRSRWINSLSSQNIHNTDINISLETLILDPKGHILYAPKIYDDGTAMWLLVEKTEADSLLTWLNSMKFMLDVQIENVTSQWAILGTCNKKYTVNGSIVWSDSWPKVLSGGASYTASEISHPAKEKWNWYQFLIPRNELANIKFSLAGIWAYEALRIAAWRPRISHEIDDKSLPHELDLLRTAVHLQKGCYRGQETIARVHNLGYPPRRICFLHIDGSQGGIPDLGSSIIIPQSGKVIGKVTSAMRHYEMGPIGLGVIKRNAITDSQVLILQENGDRYDVSIENIVSPLAGRNVKIPKNLNNKRLL